MNKKEFLSFVPKTIRSEYPLFEKYQKIANDSLIEFDRVCRKNGIIYYLAWGTLLGAIRDGGPIPWDYDADVFIRFKDKDKVIAALQKELSEGFIFECPKTNNCNHLFIRITKKGFDTSIIHLDVFYLIGTSDDPKIIRKHAKEMAKLSMKWTYKNMNIAITALGDKKIAFKAMMRKLMNSFSSSKAMLDKYNKLCSEYPFDGSRYLICADREANKHHFNAKWFETTQNVKMNGYNLLMPSKYKEILCELYGDYHMYPPPELIIKELARSINKFKRYEQLINKP